MRLESWRLEERKGKGSALDQLGVNFREGGAYRSFAMS